MALLNCTPFLGGIPDEPCETPPIVDTREIDTAAARNAGLRERFRTATTSSSFSQPVTYLVTARMDTLHRFLH